MPPSATGTTFPGHAIRHLLLVMTAPFALALSAPITLALRTFHPRSRRVLLSVLHGRWAQIVSTAPVVLVLDVGGVAAFYLTPLYSAAHGHAGLDAVLHLHMFLAGCLLSWYPDLYGEAMPSAPEHVVSCVQYGPASGPTVVLIHGIGVSRRYFSPLVKDLSRTHQVVTPDLPGFGDSGRPRPALTITELNYPITERLAAVTAPVVLIQGRHDPIASLAFLRTLAAGCTNPAQLNEIPGAGHVAMAVRPDQVAAACRLGAAPGSASR